MKTIETGYVLVKNGKSMGNVYQYQKKEDAEMVAKEYGGEVKQYKIVIEEE